MKKLFLVLLILPLFLNAQVIPNLLAPYWKPDREFYLDTNHFHQGCLAVNCYRSDKENNLFLYNVQNWETENGKFDKIVSISANPEKYFYYEMHFKYIGDKPFVIEKYTKENEKSLIKLDSKDSIVFENNVIKSVHKNVGEKYCYVRQYQYDSTMGLISTSIKIEKEVPEFLKNNCFEVISFYRPNFPSIVYEYKLSKKGQFLDRKTYHFYDSLERIAESLDSIMVDNSMRFLGSTQTIYKDNSKLIDSIIFRNSLHSLEVTYFIEYDEYSKVSRIYKFSKFGSDPIRLEERFDFKIIKSSVPMPILKMKKVNNSNTNQNPKKKAKRSKLKK